MFFSRFGFPQFHLLLSFQCLLHALCDGTMEPSNSQHKEFVESEVASVTVSKGILPARSFFEMFFFLPFFSVLFHVFPFSVPADTARGKPSSGKGPQQTREKLLAFARRGMFFFRGGVI